MSHDIYILLMINKRLYIHIAFLFWSPSTRPIWGRGRRSKAGLQNSSYLQIIRVTTKRGYFIYGWVTRSQNIIRKTFVYSSNYLRYLNVSNFKRIKILYRGKDDILRCNKFSHALPNFRSPSVTPLVVYVKLVLLPLRKQLFIY